MKIDSFQGEYRWLSNFWPCDIEFDGVVYPSVEHAYVASKTTDELLRKQVLLCKTAGEAKQLGRSFEIRKDWDKAKLSFMRYFLHQKFTKNPELRSKLASTKGMTIVEGNTWGDTFWGVCNGKGQNHLGKILMDIRDNETPLLEALLLETKEL